ncbi:MAG: hypothetical protein VB100_11065 [Angelakisella sp.]|nr:hypothetical protein [Angelakisella sp.]
MDITQFLRKAVALLEQTNKTTQHFAELVSMQKDIENELVVQAKFIRKVQSLMQNENDHLSVINHFPCPVAVFARGGVIHKANRTLIEKTDRSIDQMTTEKTSFLDRITNENFALAEAVEGVFYGKTALLSRLSCPLELFCKNWSYQVLDDCHSALLFPLPDREGYIPFGIVMLMK